MPKGNQQGRFYANDNILRVKIKSPHGGGLSETWRRLQIETASAAAPKLKQARMLPYKTCRNQPKTTAAGRRERRTRASCGQACGRPCFISAKMRQARSRADPRHLIRQFAPCRRHSYLAAATASPRYILILRRQNPALHATLMYISQRKLKQ
ncbi:hypothetical protein [Collimonas pratensis]|uniref:hypothetical protein n=1 Tax=Collimonas pratensis TaxID=279113 RepID=UPI001E577567|nr:hypothetical protein [Collimonas pratensis]